MLIQEKERQSSWARGVERLQDSVPGQEVEVTMKDPLPSLFLPLCQHIGLEIHYSVQENRLQMATSLDR